MTILMDDRGGMTITTLLPFLFHALFWITAEAPMHLMFIYNLLLLTIGLFSVFLSALNQSISYSLAILSVVETGVNAFIYCWDYHGELFCPDRKLGLEDDYRDVLLFFIIIGVVCMIAAALMLGWSVKKIRMQRLKHCFNIIDRNKKEY